MQSFRFPGRRGMTLVETNIEVHFPLLTSFGSNQNYPIRAPDTKNSGGRSILKNGYRFHFIGINGPDIVTGHTINKNKWASSVGSCCPTEIHGGIITARLATP